MVLSKLLNTCIERFISKKEGFTNPSEEVIIYEECNFKGNNFTLTKGNYNNDMIYEQSYFPEHDTYLFKDNVASIKVPRGYIVELYSDNFYSGSKTTLESDNECLNKTVGSLKIKMKEVSSVVSLYQNCDYTGYEIKLVPGDYDYSKLEILPGGFKSDDISSIKLKSGIKLFLFTGENFNGQSMIVNTDQRCLLNNIIKSVKVVDINKQGEKLDNKLTRNPLRSSDVDNVEKQVNLYKQKFDDMLFKYKEYIDIDSLRFNLHAKNEVIIKDLNKKIENQAKTSKQLNEENNKRIKIGKLNSKNSRDLEEKVSKYKKINIALVILIIILGILLFLKYKEFN